MLSQQPYMWAMWQTFSCKHTTEPQMLSALIAVLTCIGKKSCYSTVCSIVRTRSSSMSCFVCTHLPGRKV